MDPYTSTQNLVAEFHLKFSHPIATRPTMPDEKLRRLRLSLIAEELRELAEAFGFGMSPVFFDRDPTIEPNLVLAADALGDLDYVVSGANLVCGFSGGLVIKEIHRSNMAKLGPDGKPIYREDGKVLKPEGWTPPHIDVVVQEWAARP
jgi:predicted HAD superfamily Cof-like phosphohydrolase